jgi:threonylcarbamoyladenosine tRNA methylthiotransferase MtaB
LEQVAADVEERVAAGCQEVVLTGVDLGRYGREFGGSLVGLLRRLLETSVQRLRLSSLHPQDIQPALLELWSDRRLCRHFHLALQSGAAGVLRRMGRGYTPAQYRAAVQRIREALPEAALTTDVMVGFPGETQEEFEESYRFCQEMAFARTHVFRFSPRPGTAACRLGPAVPARVKEERSEAMRGLAEESARAFARSFVGRTVEVLFEASVRGLPNRWRGRTDNYLEVEVTSALPLAGRNQLVKVVGIEGKVLQGILPQGHGD